MLVRPENREAADFVIEGDSCLQAAFLPVVYVNECLLVLRGEDVSRGQGKTVRMRRRLFV